MLEYEIKKQSKIILQGKKNTIIKKIRFNRIKNKKNNEIAKKIAKTILKNSNKKNRNQI
jgi:hypothetical protein